MQTLLYLLSKEVRMTTYRFRVPPMREFEATDDDNLIREVGRTFFYAELDMPLLLKNVANACCDWNGMAYRYGTKEELIADMKKNDILINIDERKANEKS